MLVFLYLNNIKIIYYITLMDNEYIIDEKHNNQLITKNETFNIVSKQNEDLYSAIPIPIQTNIPEETFVFMILLWIQSLKNINYDSIEWLNRFLSIFFHISLMISFEIMFYFKFIINIERTEILHKISSYIDNINKNELNTSQQLAVKSLLNSDDFQHIYNELYIQYKKSLSEQHKELILLLSRSLFIASAFYFIFLCCFIFGLKNRALIKWKWIIFENIMMFTLLGIFEYLFFTQIIMNYNPITDAEIKYYVIRNIYNDFN